MECYLRQSFVYFWLQEAQGREGSSKEYKLMTSVSIPVYNKKDYNRREKGRIVSEAIALLLPLHLLLLLCLQFVLIFSFRH